MFRRILAAAALLALAAVLLVAGWPQLFGLQRTPIVAQVVALRGLAVGAAFMALIILGLLALVARPVRRFAASAAVLLLVFCAVSAAVLGVRGFGAPPPDVAADSPDVVTVLAWNTRGDAPGAERIAQLALEVDADIVSLPETSLDTSTQVAVLMRDGGKPMWSHAFTFPDSEYAKARSTAVLISPELGDYQLDRTYGSTPATPSGVFIPADGDGPTIVAAHPVAPVQGRMGAWRVGMDWLSARCATADVIMAGDFNATLDHWDGHGVDGGVLGQCRDAARTAGSAAVGTWPTDLPALAGAPIDHVLAGPAWEAIGFRVIETDDASGSDHRPVVAQLKRVSTD